MRELKFQTLTTKNWPLLENLFGTKGACGGCWCMFWRFSAKEFAEKKGEKNKREFKNLINKGKLIGVLAINNGEAIGWCAVSPRKEYVRLSTSRILKPIDEAPVWSIVCLYVKKEFRHQGISVELLKAAAQFAMKNKAITVEGYPIMPKSTTFPDVFAYTGTDSAFLKAGFKEVARRSEKRPIMHKKLTSK